MIYPHNFESKISFNLIREMLKNACLSTMGKEQVDQMQFSTNINEIRTWLQQITEMNRVIEQEENFTLQYFFDMRTALKRIRIENTHLQEDELFDLRRSLDTIFNIIHVLQQNQEEEDNPNTTTYRYPTLFLLTQKVTPCPQILQRIDQILNKLGHIRDNASPTLLQIRTQLKQAKANVSHTLNSILRSAQTDGIIDKDTAPSLRDGRLVIPIVPGLKRKIKGIVHDESATGKTVYIEPTEVVEANNLIRLLQANEQKEIIRILTAVTQTIRPYVEPLLQAYHMLANIEFIYAKTKLSKQTKAIAPQIAHKPYIDWIDAIHPLLQLSLQKQNKKVIPLTITLTPQKHILIISGPNAGGKSVCLKTVCLLQYMLQCGLCIPIAENSKAGIFTNIMIDIGDEQSIENDLSTYSSHLLNMKNMIKAANQTTLLLIDEFGTGTEPLIGGAIAQAVLQQFCNKQAWAVITTHYQNLKLFADTHPMVQNGAMLYNRQQMKPLFQLAIGQPGSSFAIEISRNIGLPQQVIQYATDIVGTNYIQSDKYLQDIVRDKKYWENKRQTIHQKEKQLDNIIQQYDEQINSIKQQQKLIINQAKQQAQELLNDANKRIENAIREIKEQQAEKQATKNIRQQLKQFEQTINLQTNKQQTAIMSDDDFAKKLLQLKQRKQRKEKRKNDKILLQQALNTKPTQTPKPTQPAFNIGCQVRIVGLTTVGTIEHIEGKNATVIFGDMRTKIPTTRLQLATTPPTQQQPLPTNKQSRTTRNTIDEHTKNFKTELDVRGMRGDEALQAVQYYIDDAILMAANQVRILHGKGNGILRQLIRNYLSTIPNVVNYRDEHVQFGGAGITVVDL